MKRPKRGFSWKKGQKDLNIFKEGVGHADIVSGGFTENAVVKKMVGRGWSRPERA